MIVRNLFYCTVDSFRVSGFPGFRADSWRHLEPREGGKDALKWDEGRNDGALIGVNVYCSLDQWTVKDLIPSTT